MKNYDTTHRGKCAAPYRAQLMLNHCGNNTVSLLGSTETFYSVKINLHFAVIPSGIYLWYICSYIDGRFSDLMEIDDLS